MTLVQKILPLRQNVVQLSKIKAEGEIIAKQEPINLLEFQTRFGSEDACREHLFQLRWPEGFRCPLSGSDQAYVIKTRHLYQCTACKH